MIIRKPAARRSRGWRSAGALVAETLALCAEHLEPGLSMLELDRLADEYIARARRRPDLEGLQGLPGRALPVAELGEAVRQKVASMQIDRNDVTEASEGSDVGIKVKLGPRR